MRWRTYPRPPERPSIDERNELLEKYMDLPGTTTAGTGGAPVPGAGNSEGGRIPYHQTSYVSEPLGGTTEYSADYEHELYDKAASDIDRMLDKMAGRSACEQLENERLSELNEMANSISYGDIHQGVNIIITAFQA